MQTFSHPGLDRILQWDLRYGADVVAELISHVADPSHRALIETAAREAWSRIAPLADELPRQAVHLDLTDANVVVSRAAGVVRADGVIDFGDLTDTWAVSELAITASSCAGTRGQRPDVGAACDQGVQRHSAAVCRRGRGRCGRCWSCGPRC